MVVPPRIAANRQYAARPLLRSSALEKGMHTKFLLALTLGIICTVPAAGQELPTCDSEQTATAFKKTIDNSPAGLAGGLRALGHRYGLEVYTQVRIGQFDYAMV